MKDKERKKKGEREGKSERARIGLVTKKVRGLGCQGSV